MPAVKRKTKTRKAKARKKTAATTGTRHATGHCRGDCRIRTKGMKVGDTRRRISKDGKKLKITRVA